MHTNIIPIKNILQSFDMDVNEQFSNGADENEQHSNSADENQHGRSHCDNYFV